MATLTTSQGPPQYAPWGHSPQSFLLACLWGLLCIIPSSHQTFHRRGQKGSGSSFPARASPTVCPLQFCSHSTAPGRFPASSPSCDTGLSYPCSREQASWVLSAKAELLCSHRTVFQAINTSKSTALSEPWRSVPSCGHPGDLPPTLLWPL